MSSVADFSVERLVEDLRSWQYYCDSNGLRFVIRHHPNLQASGSIPRASLLLDTINEVFSTSSNVRIIDPDSKMDTYFLARHAHACIAPNSGLYLQLNCTGINCMRSNDSIFYDFDDGLLAYTVADTWSMKNALHNCKYSSDPSVARSAYSYLIDSSVQIEGYPYVSTNRLQPYRL